MKVGTHELTALRGAAPRARTCAGRAGSGWGASRHLTGTRTPQSHVPVSLASRGHPNLSAGGIPPAPPKKIYAPRGSR